MTEPRWFVLRDLKRPNAKVRAYQMLKNIPDKQIVVFTPLVVRPTTLKSGKRVLDEIPYISDLLFVQSSRVILDPIIKEIHTLQYRFSKGCKQNEPMIVPDRDMNQFMAIVNGREPYKFYTPEEVTPSLYGRRIKIVGGNLDGFEGRLMTTRGSRVKRLIVELEGLLSVGVEVQPEFIQLVK